MTGTNNSDLGGLGLGEPGPGLLWDLVMSSEPPTSPSCAPVLLPRVPPTALLGRWLLQLSSVLQLELFMKVEEGTDQEHSGCLLFLGESGCLREGAGCVPACMLAVGHCCWGQAEVSV